MTAPIDSLRVLVVEDDAFQRRFAAGLLRALPVAQVIEAASGREALERIAASPPIDVMLVDLRMPDMDGVEFIRAIGVDRLGASVIIVSNVDAAMLSAVETMARGHAVNILGTVAKPLTPRRLRNLLALHGRTARGGAGDSEPVWRPAAAELVAALDSGALTVHYQPEVELENLQVVALEALVRWEHPSGGLLLPGVFLDLAENQGLMQRLTAFVLEHALGHLREWKQHGIQTRVSINLAASVLDRPGAADEIHRQVLQGHAHTSEVCLEVTEHSAATDNIVVVENLLRLRLKGFGLALDDYGTGYATMQQLNRLPLTQLKVDRQFVTDAADRPKQRTLLQSSMELAARLGLQSVAEGVERDAEWELLRGLGCNVAQGHLIAHPMPADAVADWHDTWSRTR